jgi:phosphoribosylglycinamide formyltransferase 1
MSATIGFLASHGGSSARAIVKACNSGELDATPGVLICNNGDADALRWARTDDLAAWHLSGRTHPQPDALDRAIRDVLVEHDVDLVVLSGYLKRLGPSTVAAYRGRILNIHPAPLPEFGGHGMYGLAVHEAVLAAGRATTEITVHLVDEEYDHGPVIHRQTVPVRATSDAAELQRAVSELEPQVFVKALGRVLGGETDLDDLGLL